MMEVEESPEHTTLLSLEAAVLHDIEQFGACSLGEKLKIQRLSQAIQERLSQIRAMTRDLELLFEELDSDEERQQVAALLTRHKAEYERIQQALKHAALQQRKRAAASTVEERKELLAGAADPAAKQRQLHTQADLVSASEDVTDGLRRTRQVLAEQLEHTNTTLAAMEQSHTQLGKTKDEYHQQAGQLKTSKGLLGTLNWQANAERLMLWGGLAIFMVVVAYIVQKRVGYFLPSALSPSALLSRTGLLPKQPPTAAPPVAGGGQGLPGAGAPPPFPPTRAPGDVPGLPPHFEHRQTQQQEQQEDWERAAPLPPPPAVHGGEATHRQQPHWEEEQQPPPRPPPQNPLAPTAAPHQPHGGEGWGHYHDGQEEPQPPPRAPRPPPVAPPGAPHGPHVGEGLGQHDEPEDEPQPPPRAPQPPPVAPPAAPHQPHGEESAEYHHGWAAAPAAPAPRAPPPPPPVAPPAAAHQAAGEGLVEQLQPGWDAVPPSPQPVEPAMPRAPEWQPSHLHGWPAAPATPAPAAPAAPAPAPAPAAPADTPAVAEQALAAREEVRAPPQQQRPKTWEEAQEQYRQQYEEYLRQQAAQQAQLAQQPQGQPQEHHAGMQHLEQHAGTAKEAVVEGWDVHSVESGLEAQRGSAGEAWAAGAGQGHAEAAAPHEAAAAAEEGAEPVRDEL